MSLLLSLTLLLAVALLGARLWRWRAPALAAQICLMTALVAIALPAAELIWPGWRQPQLLNLPFSSDPQPLQRQLSGGIGEGDLLPLAATPSASPVRVAAFDPVPILKLAWAMGALTFLLLWLHHLLTLRRQVLAATRDARLERRFSLLSRRPLRIGFSDQTVGAFLWHGREAVVVMPERYRSLPLSRLRLIVLHELAHHARGDNRRLACLRLCRIMWWFHPLAWWLERQGLDCAELAADDEVLQRQVDPDDYLAMLASLARGGGRSMPAMRLLGMGLRARLQRLIRPPRPTPRGIQFVGAALLFVAGASLAAIDLRFARHPGDDWVLGLRTVLTPHRFDDLPAGRMQVATFFDGHDSDAAHIAIELSDTDGRRRWYRIPALIKFDRGMRRAELDLADGIAPTGRLQVVGIEPDGIVDGVGVGLAWRSQDSVSQFRRSRSLQASAVQRTVCSWPLGLTAERMLDDGQRIEHWEMDTLQRLLCGAELVDNGLHSL